MKNIFSILFKPKQLKAMPASLTVRDGIILYTQDNGQVYIDKGYNLNDAVFSIVSRNAEKAGQVRLYHVKVKSGERKTRQEYEHLIRQPYDIKAIAEMKRMRKAMTEDRVADTPLSKLLDKPNRAQTQSEWLENLIGLRELQGEGNIWIVKGAKGKPLELVAIPRQHVQVVADPRDPFNVQGWVLHYNEKTVRLEPEEMIMWKYSNPTTVNPSFEHLRGMPPLKSFLVQMQAMNEADNRVASANNNAGASGLLYRKDTGDMPTDKAILDGVRRQIDNTVNSSDLAGKIAWMAGEWGYLQFGKSLEELKVLEQYSIGFKRLCRVFKTPPGIFEEGNDTYENQRQYERKWIYGKIAPMIYQLRGVLNDDLIPMFGLDPERDMVDCDIMSLPELAIDLKEQVAALKDASWLTDNEKRIASGYEAINNPALDKTQRELDEEAGGGLDDEINLLNGR